MGILPVKKKQYTLYRHLLPTLRITLAKKTISCTLLSNKWRAKKGTFIEESIFCLLPPLGLL